MKSVAVIVWVSCQLSAATACAELAIIEVAPGVYRGPAPETAADYRQLRCLGVKTILDIRGFRRRQLKEAARCARAHGLCYLNVPVAFRPQRDCSPERALAALANSRRHPIYIHCKLGEDRAGLVVALHRVRCQGWSRCAAHAEMMRLGFKPYFRAMEQYFWDHAK
jgi:hypothetical protein